MDIKKLNDLIQCLQNISRTFGLSLMKLSGNNPWMYLYKSLPFGVNPNQDACLSHLNLDELTNIWCGGG